MAVPGKAGNPKPERNAISTLIFMHSPRENDAKISLSFLATFRPNFGFTL